MDILTCLCAMLLLGLVLGSLCKKIKLPPLIGMIAVGVVFGASVLNIIPQSVYDIAGEIKQLALVIILLRAGLSLDFSKLKGTKVATILMCFLPALIEITAYVVVASLILNLSVIDGLLLGTVMAAVSPAIIVPRMIAIKEKGYGADKGIPELVLAGASVDDVFVIVLFTAMLGISSSGEFTLSFLWQTPVSIILGVAVGILIGYLLAKLLKKIHIRDTIKVIILVCVSAFFIFLENILSGYVPYASLLSVMALGFTYYKFNPISASKVQDKFSKVWIVAEVFLFTLVGSVVDLSYITTQAPILILAILLCLLARVLGTYLCFIKSSLNNKERLFCMLSYSPKATVQAGIGAIPLSLGLACGNLILSTAILGILISAPLGAFLIDLSYKKLLARPLETLD